MKKPFEPQADSSVDEQIRRLPWWMISLGFHAMLGFVLWLSVFNTYAPRSDVEIQIEVEPVEPEDVPLVYRDIEHPEDYDINTDEPPIEDPVLRDAEISDSDRMEDEDGEGVEYICGKESMPEPASDKPFQGRYWNSAIGIGGGQGGSFCRRFNGRRNLRAYGGGRRTESAALMGQVWLKKHQNPDGLWSCDRFNANCQEGVCSGTGSSSQFDLGVTSLALLAFLGAGHTHRHGKFKRTVKKTLKALKDRQQGDGCFGKRTGDGHWIYNHLLGTLALSEAYGLSGRSPLLGHMAQKGVDYLVKCQTPYAGWRYGCRPGDSDTSCTAWAVLALKSARLSGLTVPKEAEAGALAWLDKATDETTGRAGYRQKGGPPARPADRTDCPPTESMTAAAMISRIFLGQKASHPALQLGAARLAQNLPVWDTDRRTVDMYYWYYGTLAMFQLGGPHWKAWNPALKNALIPTQIRKGCANGSWDPVGVWGAAGRVYSTAINVLSLEVYYRYGRVLERR